MEIARLLLPVQQDALQGPAIADRKTKITICVPSATRFVTDGTQTVILSQDDSTATLATSANHWVNASPETMAVQTLAGFPTRFEWALDDLRALVSGRPSSPKAGDFAPNSSHPSSTHQTGWWSWSLRSARCRC
jgi:hypothetical protein